MRVGRPSGGGLGAAIGLAALLVVGVQPAAASAPAPVFGPPRMLPGANGGTEPRVAIAPDGTRYVISGQPKDGSSTNGATAMVWTSHDGGVTWRKTGGVPAGQVMPLADVDLVITSTGRLVATELDEAGLTIVVSYSDDGGNTWTASLGTRLADQDRPWLATGPDPSTHQPRVYLLFHNAASSNIDQNVFVETSTDNGATFGPPVPITIPGTPEWLDLQCGGSGGPSDLVVNQTTGRIYAFWGTRDALAGSCGAMPVEPYTFVTATRAWAATSADGSLGSWTSSLGADGSATNNIVGLWFTPGALDTAGNVWMVYVDTPKSFPDYSGAAVRVRHSDPELRGWSAPITIAPRQQPGNLLPHIIAGEPGKFDVSYFAGASRAGASPLWYETVSQVLDGLSASPTVTTERLATFPAAQGTASQMMLVCDPSPVTGIVQNNFLTCPSSTDVWGVALDRQCDLTVAWPSVAPANDSVLGVSYDATWVSTQIDGPSLCSMRETVKSAAATPAVLPNTGRGLLEAPLVVLIVAVFSGWGFRRGRSRERPTARAGD